MLRNTIAALLLVTSSSMALADGPGPNLVIDVTGVANGQIVIDMAMDVAPKHVAQILALAKSGAYDGVVFHRVIDGFMAQTGDVQYGKSGADTAMAGMGGSQMPNIAAEFSDIPFARGVVGMARAQDPDSANSQFFIMFAPGDFLNGQYTVVGTVISGMDVVDAIAKGEPPATPDVMAKVTVAE
jgi:peptidylprolyl isomerase